MNNSTSHPLIDKLEKLEKGVTESDWHLSRKPWADDSDVGLTIWGGPSADPRVSRCIADCLNLFDLKPLTADYVNAALIVELRNNYKKLIQAIGVWENGYQKAKKTHDDELGIGNNYHEAWTEFVMAMDDAKADVKELLG